MIFLSLGTHQQPFPRAIDLVLPVAEAGNRVVVQHGSTPSRPGVPNVEWVELVGAEELPELIAESDGFVCHAGVGTIFTALAAGVCPVVLPRRAALGEHVDDHQVELAHALAERGLVVLGEDGVQRGLELARRVDPGPIPASPALLAAVAAAVS